MRDGAITFSSCVYRVEVLGGGCQHWNEEITALPLNLPTAFMSKEFDNGLSACRPADDDNQPDTTPDTFSRRSNGSVS